MKTSQVTLTEKECALIVRALNEMFGNYGEKTIDKAALDNLIRKLTDVCSH